jgi:dolichol-phosphate mannosyltransferase
MKLSVIIPVYNEEKDILQVINEVGKVELSKEIIVVDDASTDETSSLLAGLKKTNLKIFHHPYNRGKGAAIRTGIKHATGDIILIQDADLEYNPKDYSSLVAPIMEKKAAVVYGSRFKGKVKNMKFFNRVANRILTLTANLLYRISITDEATCYKVFRADILKKQKLKCNRFDFCPEITAKLSKQGVKIFEVPISYKARTQGEGKKIRWMDGFTALWALLKYRVTD